MHSIDYLTFTSRKVPKTIQKECDKIAERYGDCGGGLYKPVRFMDIVKKNYQEAYDWIQLNDSGWYDNLAVKYKDGGAIKWLVKIEYHT